MRKKTEYGLVDMDLSKGSKKVFIGDSEVSDVKDADMLRRRDAM